MSNAIQLPPGVLVKCPGCLAEVHASEGPADPGRPFRCLACRRRTSEFVALHQAEAMKGRSRNAKRSKSDDNVSDPAASPGSDGEGD